MADGNASISTRTNAANAAALTPVAMNPVTGVGEPSYTSGAHMWNGTAATLNPNPMIRSPSPSDAIRPSGLPASCAPGEREIGGAGRAIDQRDAVEQETRRERPDQEILERRLGRERVRPVEAGEHVDRDRHHLEPEKQDDEVLRPAEEHHAGGREQHERVVLRRQQPLPLEVPEREENRGARAEQRDGGHAVAERIERHHLGQAVGRGAAHPERCERGGAEHDAREAEPAREAAVRRPLMTPAHDQENHEGPAGQDDLRQQREGHAPRSAEVDAVHRPPSDNCALDRSAAPAVVGPTPGAAASRNRFEEGSMRSRTGLG